MAGSPNIVSGKVSWFGGPNDSSTGKTTASGASINEPGIAIYDHATLGGYWRVTGANGRSAILKQTDLGPAPWTGRKIDVSYSALGHLGYSEHNFPTDSNFKATYLGKSLPKGVNAGPVPISESTLPKFNEAGFNEAQQHAKALRTIAGLFSGSETAGGGGGGLGPLAGLLSPTSPTKAQFTTPGQPSAPKAEAAPGSLSELGGLLPKGTPLSYQRIDEGQDVQLKPGQALYAPGDGEVIAVKVDPTGFGPDYPVVKFTSGPMAGKSIYLGHTDTALKQGQTFKAGEVLARTSKTGHNAPPGWAEIGWGNTLGQGNQGQGKSIASYLR